MALACATSSRATIVRAAPMAGEFLSKGAAIHWPLEEEILSSAHAARARPLAARFFFPLSPLLPIGCAPCIAPPCRAPSIPPPFVWRIAP